MQNFRAHVVCPRTFLFAILVALPCGARAADMSLAGGSGCSDPAITSDRFTLPATNGGGGLCRAFGNHSPTDFTSLRIVTSFPTNTSDPFLCSGASYFTSCDFILDGVTILHNGDFARSTGSSVVVEFFGIDTGPGGTHHGIPIDTNTDPASSLYYNFFLNLNNPVIDPTNGTLVQPNNTAPNGDWQPNTAFTGGANGAVPEPGTLALLVTAAGALLARNRWRKTARR